MQPAIPLKSKTRPEALAHSSRTIDAALKSKLDGLGLTSEQQSKLSANALRDLKTLLVGERAPLSYKSPTGGRPAGSFEFTFADSALPANCNVARLADELVNAGAPDVAAQLLVAVCPKLSIVLQSQSISRCLVLLKAGACIQDGDKNALLERTAYMHAYSQNYETIQWEALLKDIGEKPRKPATTPSNPMRTLIDQVIRETEARFREPLTAASAIFQLSQIAATATKYGDKDTAERAGNLGENDNKPNSNTGRQESQRKPEKAAPAFFPLPDTVFPFLTMPADFLQFESPMIDRSETNNRSVQKDDVKSPLYKACVQGDPKAVKKLLKSADAREINRTDAQGRSPLHVAARNGNLKLVRMLIEHGAAHSSTPGIDTPLGLACEAGHAKIVRALLEARGDQIDLDALIEASWLEEASEAEDSSGHGAPAADKVKQTLLHVAARQGHLDVIKVLCDFGAESTLANGATPWKVAVDAGQFEAALFLKERFPSTYRLVDKTAGPSASPSQTVQRSATQLQLPVSLVSPGLQAPGTSPSAVLIHSFPPGLAKSATPLHDACAQGNVSEVKRLLKKNETAINGKNAGGETALHKAAARGELKIVELLIGGGAKFLADESGYTPLHVACKKDRIDVVKTLLKHRPEAALESLSDGRTPFYFAVKKGHVKVVELLISELRKQNVKQLPMLQGETLLHVAMDEDTYKPAVVEVLLKRFPDSVNLPNEEGWTPLHRAVDEKNAAAINQLLKAGASNKAAGKLLSPFMCACRMGHVDSVKAFLEVQPKAAFEKTPNGTTPLHYAALHGHAKIVQLLIDKGVEHTTTQKGNTPLKLARDGGHAGVVKILTVRFIDKPRLEAGSATPKETVAASEESSDVIIASSDEEAPPKADSEKV
jgi:ankyrin repeat protein